MCNYFGNSGCSGKDEESDEAQRGQVQNAYNAMLANAPWNRWEQFQNLSNKDLDMKPKRIKKGILTQADIDRPLPPVSRRCASWREVLEWLDGDPGAFLSIALVIIVLGLIVWGVYANWPLPVDLATGGRG